MICSVCGNQIEDNIEYCPSCGSSTKSETVPVQEKKKKRSFKIMPILIALVAIAVVAIGGFFLFKALTSSNGTAVAFVKNGKLYYKANASSDKDAFEITDLDSEDSSYNVFFSNNGEYLYFFEKAEDECGNLSYIKVKDIKSNADKNEDKVEKIESGVYVNSASPAGENGVVYYTNNFSLEYFDGEKSEKIAENVADWEYDEEKNALVYYVYDENDNYYKIIYAVGLSDDLEPKKIDDNVINIISLVNSDFIVYTKTENNKLYEAGFERDAKLVSDKFLEAVKIDNENKNMIYAETDEETTTLSAFVEDDCLASDNAVQKPEPMNYATVVGLDVVLTEGDFEYYSEYPEELPYFYDDLWTDDTIEMFYYYNSDTDVYYYYDGTNWLNMDVELYQKDLEDYEAIAERNKLRERLAEEEYSQNQKAVYYYESGKEPECLVKGVDSIVAGDVTTKFISYEMFEVAKIKMSEIEDVYDVYDYVEGNGKEKTYYQMNGADPIEFEQKYIKNIALSDDKMKVAIVVYNEDSDRYELLYGEINNNAIANVETLTTEDYQPKIAWKDNGLYYMKDVDGDTGNLYILKEGESEKISACSSVYGYSENCIVFYKENKLCIYDGSDDIKTISKKVEAFDIYVPDTNKSDIMHLQSY